MRASPDKLKKLAIRLSAKAQEYVRDTLPSRLPLKASDLAQHHPITKLVHEAGFSSIYDCLHTLVDNKLDDLIKGLSYKRKYIDGKERIEWSFNVSSELAKQTAAAVDLTSRALTIDVDESCGIFFKEEITILKRYQKHFEELVNGKVEPKTELQERFVVIAKSLLDRANCEINPKFYYEKIIAKYLIFKFYIPK